MHRRWWKSAVVAVLVALNLVSLVAVGALAATQHRVYQLNSAFEPFGLIIKPGDSVEFVNDDPFEHNVYSPTSGNRFDIGIQEPGTSTVIRFDEPGEVVIRCRIHLKMRLSVVVEP